MWNKKHKRTPKGYDGTKPTGHSLCDVLSISAANIEVQENDRPNQVVSAWPEIIGERFASMTQAVKFENRILFVNVSNSTLHSLLSQNDKQRVLNLLKEKFPNQEIRDIIFRIG
jgi:hypothetical protein